LFHRWLRLPLLNKIGFNHEGGLFGAAEHQCGGLNAGEDQRTPEARVSHRHGTPLAADSDKAPELHIVTEEPGLPECDRVLEDIGQDLGG
jgi:hypothetical protein